MQNANESLLQNGAVCSSNTSTVNELNNQRGILKKGKLKNSISIDDAADADLYCGIGPCTPKWAQVFATKEIYLLIYCLVGLCMGLFFTYGISVISTVEKRFKMTSKQTGVILAGNDISQVLFALFVSYFGNHGHRTRWMAVGSLCAALASLLAAFPHFIYGPGEDADNMAQSSLGNHSIDYSQSLSRNELCYSPIEENCDDDKPGESTYGPFLLFFLSQFLTGISITMYYSIGFVYLDDNTAKNQTPLYYSISLILRVLGPVLGFVLGSQCLKLWITPQIHPNISTRDPRWFGAWWLGYLVIAISACVSGSLLFFFPRKLPETLNREIQKLIKKDTETGEEHKPIEYYTHVVMTVDKQLHKKPSTKKMVVALKRLFSSKIYVGSLWNIVFMFLAISGYWNFKPKYLENQFRKSASDANLYAGMANLVSSVLGLAIGGIVLRYIRPRAKYVAGYSIILTLIDALCMASLMFVGCPKLDIVGPGPGNLNTSSCTSDCQCTDRYSPVCASDNVTHFYSACYAGCTEVDTTSNPINIAQVNDEAIQGYCPENCMSFFIYISIQTFSRMMSCTGRVGSQLLLIRAINEEDKALAIGSHTVFISLFAFIPAPIIIGAIVDSSCIIWEESCGKKGNCWLYDSDKFRLLLHAFPAVILLVSSIGEIVIFINCDHVKLYGEDEDEDKTKNKEIEMDNIEETKQLKSRD